MAGLRNPPRVMRFVVTVAALVAVPCVCAADPTPDPAYALCPADFGPSFAASTALREPAAGEWSVLADRVDSAPGQYRFEGAVELWRGDERLQADRAQFDNITDSVRATGHIRYRLPGTTLVAEELELDAQGERARLAATRFWLTREHLRGEAGAVRVEGASRLVLEDSRFTRCADMSDDWYIKASRLELDTARNEAVAHNARVEFMHVPIFYFPYLSFPLIGRKTGFLVPNVGWSANAISEFSAPFYWNIAPDRDATITPRYLADRGLQWQTEFRYLNPASQGQLNVEYLPNDTQTQRDRAFGVWRHSGWSDSGWRTEWSLQQVSDPDYLVHLGEGLNQTTTTFLESRADATYRGDQWWFQVRGQDFQTLDATILPSARPYRRLPELHLGYQAQALGTRLDLDTEWVRFDRAGGVTGNRLDLYPRLTWPWRGVAGHVTPGISYRYTAYQLSGQAPGLDDQPVRGVPLYSLDAGLALERELSLAGRTYTQTLEPRLYYLYVPYTAQDDLVVFDTSQPRFGFDPLFRENRFSGADRVGDANQISLALSSRVLDTAGWERLRLSLGRAYYRADRRVTLPGALVETAARSDLLAELGAALRGDLRARATVRWDAQAARADRVDAYVDYDPAPRRHLALGYHYEQALMDQAELSLLWPVTLQWHLMGRWQYSLRSQQSLERLEGLEYESCCWSVRVLHRYFVTDTAQPGTDTLWFQLELKGLTRFGRPIENLLDHGILSQ